MRLKRVGDHAHEAKSEDYSIANREDGQRAEVRFPQFGTGSEKTSFFIASFNWADAEALIRTFADAGHPAAIRIQRAIRLAASIEELAKNSN